MIVNKLLNSIIKAQEEHEMKLDEVSRDKARSY